MFDVGYNVLFAGDGIFSDEDAEFYLPPMFDDLGVRSGAWVEPSSPYVSSVIQLSDGSLSAYEVPTAANSADRVIDYRGEFSNAFKTTKLVDYLPLKLMQYEAMAIDKQDRTYWIRQDQSGQEKFYLSRVLPGGALDDSFQLEVTRASTELHAAAMCILPGGELLVSGAFSSIGGNPVQGVCVVNEDGTVADTQPEIPTYERSSEFGTYRQGPQVILQSRGYYFIAEDENALTTAWAYEEIPVQPFCFWTAMQRSSQVCYVPEPAPPA